jgi:acetyl esterase/lipase
MSTNRLLGVGALCVAIAAAACSSDGISTDAQPPPATTDTTASSPVARQDVQIRQRIAAAGSTSPAPQTATLQTPANLSGTSPVVVLLHGAGGPAKESMAPMADAIAAMQIPVLNVSWLASPTQAAVSAADAVCAVAYAYQNASSWGANPNRIVVMGHSGGGQVGMLAALAPDSFPECATASDAHVWAYIGLAGDPASAAPGGNLRRFLIDDPELLARMDNYTHVGGNPQLIARFVHGTADGLVPIELTGAFHDALISAGYNSELIPIDGAGHHDPSKPTTEAGDAALEQLGLLIETVQP